MLIAIPTINQKLCQHFGHCEQFAFAEVDEENQTILHVRYLQAPIHTPGSIPSWLNDNGTQLVIASGIGNRALSFFDQWGINVVVGAKEGSPKDIIAAYFKQQLETENNPCNEKHTSHKCEENEVEDYQSITMKSGFRCHY
ncbi:NifB/NifX family molybdenum-iron cluster-binding protein [Teredinibacter sp. KSP-S5-2]|uniref:NifB/NifX family molybdenum-iron cluster-binding protein n=1 Tax=Teredinibacter sp. KSP-S5-2 TaxID=3034506 RepID=UPI0029342468|nr:NifB/NifX family molybdenum-iron cluster-binding protein [Teredinibacter sp. KSP-S5-2]WNO10667.1 NifB/NifX family molybdenum-iron cluster-binding protein [Teredinibacter sp. KSP-S5-2]